MILVQKDGQNKRKVQEIIVKWAKNNLKRYSWRTTSDPYKILISELLLHKTDAKKVEQVYPQFVEKFPTIMSIFQANVGEIERLFRKIGLFYRAKRIRKIAEQIIDEFNGVIPDSKRELVSLYGVGDYISNAVLCFAFKRRVPIVDTNVIRVYARVFGLKSSKSRPRTDNAIWDFAEEILPTERYVEYNYALLDFASDVCRSRKPLCHVCDLQTLCETYKRSQQNA